MEASLRELRYAVAAADSGSVTAAAEQLFVAQPSVSRQIRALEDRLGFEVFDRHPGGVTPTPAGAIVIETARDMLDRWETCLVAARAATSPQRVRLGLHTAVGRGILARLGHELAAEGRTMAVEIIPWTDPTAGLGTGAVDLALLWGPLEHESLEVIRELAREPLSALLPSTHPRAGARSLSFEDIVDEPIIALPRAAGALREYWIGGELRSRPARIALEASTADETVEAVGAGLGIALVAAGNAEIYGRDGITAVPIEDLPAAQLLLCRRRG